MTRNIFQTASVLAIGGAVCMAPLPALAQQTEQGAPPVAGAAADAGGGEVAGAAGAGAPDDGTIIMQDADTVLASDLIGATVYSAADESIGDINDVLVSTSGSVEGVVVGVGGFLGLGEKDVAVTMQRIRLVPSENGNPRLTLNMTRDALESAPEFVTVSERNADAMPETAPAPGMGTVTQ